MSQQAPIKVGNYAYSETDMIGKGSYGKVFKGKNVTNGTTVAIKVIIVESNKQSMQIKMIKNEVDALKRSKTENVVHLLDFIVQNNMAYIVTEFCNQKDLKHYLAKKKILQEKKAVEFLKQIVGAFKELCKRQVLHRDLKPANIMIHNGVCKIGDFGFAKTLDFSVTDYNTQMVSIVGTPLYMSPQLLDKQKYSTKSDIWSLGIIFYEMLFGRVPWTGKDPATYSKNIRNQPLTFDRSICNLSADAEDFLEQCLKVNEEDRIGWKELFNHPLVSDDVESSQSTKEDSTEGDYVKATMPEKRIKDYKRGPINPSHLMKMKSLEKSKEMTASQAELTRTTIDQKLRQMNQLSWMQSTVLKGTVNPQSKLINLSFNDDGKTEVLQTQQQLKSTGAYLKESHSHGILASPSESKKLTLTKISDDAQDEYKKIETPLLVLKHKLMILSALYSKVHSGDDFKDLPALSFNFLITVSRLINIIFKQLSSQVLTKKVKTRSHLLSEYLESDSFKRLVVFAETEKKKYEEMLKNCSRKLFELNLSSDKEKDEVLEYYQEIMNEVEEQALLGRISDMANQVLYQIRFSSQSYKKSSKGRTMSNGAISPGKAKENLEKLLAYFGDDSILDSFKYDRVDEILVKIQSMK